MNSHPRLPASAFAPPILRTLLLASLILAMCSVGHALALGKPASSTQSTETTLPIRLQQALTRASNGHSPTAEEIASFATSDADATAVTQSVPLLLKAFDSSDLAVRALALAAINGLQTAPAAPLDQSAPLPSDSSKPADQPAAPSNAKPLPTLQPTAYKPETARALTSIIPKLATELTDDSHPNRVAAASALGGFTPDPPPTLYPPLLAFLKRDDAISPVGLAVVSDLLQIAPLSVTTAEAIARYLRRSDQTPDARANLADTIATARYQSPSLNKALILYLDSDDPSLRARIILSLPALDLAPDLFADTKARVSQLAENPNENLQVVTAAKAVVPCWIAPKMSAGCPVYQ